MSKNKVQESKSQLPLEIQLQAVCILTIEKSYDSLVPFLPKIKECDPKHVSYELYKKYVKKHLNFTAIELIKYLEAHPETCKDILNNSYDKRYTPSTFIEEWQNNQYRVGWVPSGKNLINQIRVFSNFAEATADYILFSWGLPRLTKEQANWFEIEHY